MGIIAPNQKKLIIPGKTDPSAPLYYARDMRTIEQWANAQQAGGGGITDITTGTPSILTITNPTGPTVNIDSTGGGGGGGRATGAWVLTAGPDSRAFNNVSPFGINLSGVSMPPSGAQFETDFFSQAPTSSFAEFLGTASWLWSVGAGWSVSFLPELQAPTFTGVADIQFALVIQAFALDLSDSAIYQTNLINIASGASYQSQDTDFVNVLEPPFGDLSLQPFGTAFEGNGIVSAAGNIYFGSAQAIVSVPAAAVFT